MENIILIVIIAVVIGLAASIYYEVKNTLGDDINLKNKIMILRIIFLVMLLWAVFTTIQQMILLVKEAGLYDCVKDKKNILRAFIEIIMDDSITNKEKEERRKVR